MWCFAGFNSGQAETKIEADMQEVPGEHEVSCADVLRSAGDRAGSGRFYSGYKGQRMSGGVL